MSIQDKQEYLREQILDKDYDPEEFVQFITTHFGMDQNQVLNITLDQLKMIVSEFVQNKTQVNSPEAQKNVNKEAEDEFGEFGESQVAQVSAPIVIDFDWSYLGTPKKQQPKPVIKQEPKPKKQEIKKAVINATLLDLMDQPVEKPKVSIPVPTTVPSLLASDVYNQMFKSPSQSLKIKTIKQSPSELDSFTNISFQVKDHNVQDNTKSYLNKLLGSKEVLYTVLTEGRSKQNKQSAWQVSRKFTDFEWLRTCFLRKYPGLIIPPLPKHPDIQSPVSILSTKNKLSYFLNQINKQPSLKSSKYFQIFIVSTTYSDFDSYKKSNELVQKPQTISNIQNATGEVECNFSQGLDPFSQLIVDYSGKVSLEMRKVKQISKEVTLLFYNINLKFNEITEIFTKVQGLTEEISSSKNEFAPLKKLAKTYEYLSGLIADHSTIMLKQKDRVDQCFKDYFSYEDSKLKEIKTLVDKRNEFSSLYAKRSAAEIKDVSPGVLSKFSSALFGSKQQSVDSPSTSFKTFKNQFGFFNEQMVKQSVQFVDREVLSYTEHFTKYANDQLSNLDEMQEYWSNVIVSLSRLNVGALF